jgi:hypothetical protein
VWRGKQKKNNLNENNPLWRKIINL